MVYFLKSYCLGINYNDCPPKLTPQRAKDQFEQWKISDKYKSKGTELEQKLIDAMSIRVNDGIMLEHAVSDK